MTTNHDDRNKTADRDERAQRDTALRLLAQAGGAGFRDDDVTFEGRKLVLPEGSSIRQNIKHLQRIEEEQEENADFSRTFRFRPWDGAYATFNALKKAFGAVGHGGTPGFFGPNPPALIDVPVSPTESVQVPWGSFTLPILEGVTLYAGHTHDAEYGLLYSLTASGPKKFRDQIEGLFNLVAVELEANSLYRGKAIDGQGMPNFLDLSKVDRSKVVYSDEVLAQIEANIFAPIRYADEMRRLGVPLKRAALIHGPYGTGKTLAAFLTAQEAVEHGWTFLYARPGRDDLDEVMRTARLYEPAVVFFEDVDVIADPNEGTDAVSKLLDVFDGIASKGVECMAILTTNHPERIHKGMVRPGRLDAVIRIADLDAQGIRRMIETTIPESMFESAEVDWDAVTEANEGYLPAFVKEAADRAIRYALTRTKGRADLVTIGTADLVRAAEGLRPQLALMEDAPEHANRDSLTSAMVAAVAEGIRPAVDAAIQANVQERLLTEEALGAVAVTVKRTGKTPPVANAN